jgi:hypothetical protein
VCVRPGTRQWDRCDVAVCRFIPAIPSSLSSFEARETVLLFLHLEEYANEQAGVNTRVHRSMCADPHVSQVRRLVNHVARAPRDIHAGERRRSSATRTWLKLNGRRCRCECDLSRWDVHALDELSIPNFTLMDKLI